MQFLKCITLLAHWSNMYIYFITWDTQLQSCSQLSFSNIMFQHLSLAFTFHFTLFIPHVCSFPPATLLPLQDCLYGRHFFFFLFVNESKHSDNLFLLRFIQMDRLCLHWYYHRDSLHFNKKVYYLYMFWKQMLQN